MGTYINNSHAIRREWVILARSAATFVLVRLVCKKFTTRCVSLVLFDCIGRDAVIVDECVCRSLHQVLGYFCVRTVKCGEFNLHPNVDVVIWSRSDTHGRAAHSPTCALSTINDCKNASTDGAMRDVTLYRSAFIPLSLCVVITWQIEGGRRSCPTKIPSKTF